MERITSILFDLDGTLYINSELGEEIQQVAAGALARQLAITPAEADARLTTAKQELSTRTGCEATLSAAWELLGGDIKVLHRSLAEQVNPEKYLLRDDRVVELLGRLAAEYGLYLYTNNNRSLTDRIIRALGIEEFFAEIFTVEDFWRAKPDRLALAKVYAAIGAEPVECLFVGDRYDIDLRLPAEHGSKVFLTTSLEQLLSLQEVCKKGEWTDD